MKQTRVELHHGDCLEVMPTLAAGNVAFVFADLPYGVTRREWDTPICLTRFWQCLYSIINNRGCAVAATATQPFASKVIASNAKHFRYDLIWDKTRTTGFLNANRMPLRRHESVLIFYTRLSAYNTQKVAGKAWRKRRAKTGDGNYGTVKSNGHLQISDGMRYPTSILCVPSGNAKSLHSTQKPIALLEWLIKTYTNAGDTVLDPVMGSGTTGVACKRLGRHFIGIEKDATYFAAAKARIDAELWPDAADAV